MNGKQDKEILMSDPIRVLIVDDHIVVRSGLRTFLDVFDDLELVGEAKDGEEAIGLCERLEPDVILMDLIMPGVGGVAATKEISERFQNVRVIALTSFADRKLVNSIIEAGAVGYLLKNSGADEIANAIRNVWMGDTALGQEAAKALVDVVRRPVQIMPTLTEREKDVMELLIEGMNNVQIAEKLIISRSTVKYHVSSIIAKLGVTNRTEAVAFAVKNKILDN